MQIHLAEQVTHLEDGQHQPEGVQHIPTVKVTRTIWQETRLCMQYGQQTVTQ